MEEVRSLREEGARLRERLNRLRGFDPATGQSRKEPADEAGKAEWAKLMPRYKAIKEALRSFDA